MYAIVNEANQYLRVFNVNYDTGFLAATRESSPPFQAVKDIESAEKVISILKNRPLIDWDGNGKEPRIEEVKQC